VTKVGLYRLTGYILLVHVRTSKLKPTTQIRTLMTIIYSGYLLYILVFSVLMVEVINVFTKRIIWTFFILPAVSHSCNWYLLQTRQAFSAEQINDATYVDISGNKAVFDSLRNNLKVHYDGRRFSYKVISPWHLCFQHLAWILLVLHVSCQINL
jgi:hypothetical protein